MSVGGTVREVLCPLGAISVRGYVLHSAVGEYWKVQSHACVVERQPIQAKWGDPVGLGGSVSDCNDGNRPRAFHQRL